MRSRVFFAWELGANLGHVLPLAHAARDLAQHNIDCTFAVKDLGAAALAFPGADSAGIQVIQAPVWPQHRHFGHSGRLSGLTDILASAGLMDARKVSIMMRAWRALLDHVRPDVIVADHAPALLAATYRSGTPVVSVGTPFLMPPILGGRFAPLQATSQPLVSDQALAKTIQQACASLGLAGPAQLTDLYRTQASLTFGLAEFDPYFALRQEPLFDPLEPLPEWSALPESPRLFVYLGPETPNFEMLCQALAMLGLPIEAHFRGERSPAIEFLRLRGHTIHDSPVPLAEVLPRVSHVISLGGLGTAQAAFSSGRPHLIMPLHDETAYNLRILSDAGSGQQLWPEPDERNLRKQIHAFLANGHRASAAREAALKAAMRPRRNGAEALRGAILSLLGKSQSV